MLSAMETAVKCEVDLPLNLKTHVSTTARLPPCQVDHWGGGGHGGRLCSVDAPDDSVDSRQFLGLILFLGKGRQLGILYVFICFFFCCCYYFCLQEIYDC